MTTSFLQGSSRRVVRKFTSMLVVLSSLAFAAEVCSETYPVDLSVPFDTPSPLGSSGITYTLTLSSAYDGGVVPLLGFRSGAGRIQRWPNGNFGLLGTNYGFTITFSEPGTIVVTNTTDEDPNYRGGAMSNDHWRLTGDAGIWELVDAGEPSGIEDGDTSINGTVLELGWDGSVGNSTPWGSASLVGGSGVTIRSTLNHTGNGGRLLFTSIPAAASALPSEPVPLLGVPALGLLGLLLAVLAGRQMMRIKEP